MNLLDCCCDCCSSITCCSDCCSMDACCCPDCYGAGSLPSGIKDLVENWLENNVTIVSGSDYILPTATESVKGGVKVGHSLMMNGEGDEVMNVALDTVPSTVEGFMWINDIVATPSGGFDDPDWDSELDNIFKQ